MHEDFIEFDDLEEGRSGGNFSILNVSDPIPIDTLDKLPDKAKNIQMLCEQAMFEILNSDKMFIKGEIDEDTKKPKEVTPKKHFKIIRSRPYCRKCNLVNDKSIKFIWEMVFRFNKFDIYVSILRRSYIPPFADTY